MCAQRRESMAVLGVAAATRDPLQIECWNQLGQDRLLKVGRQVQGVDPGLDGPPEEGQGSQPLDRQALRLGETFAGAGGSVGRLGEVRQARPHVSAAGGHALNGLCRAAREVIRVIQRTEFTDRLTGLRWSRQGLGLLAFGVDHVDHGGVNPGREGRGAAARMRNLRVIRALGGPRGRQRRLGRRDGGSGLFDLTGQVQTGPLRDLMLTMKEVCGMRRAEVLLHVATQRLRFITGTLDDGC